MVGCARVSRRWLGRGGTELEYFELVGHTVIFARQKAAAETVGDIANGKVNARGLKLPLLEGGRIDHSGFDCLKKPLRRPDAGFAWLGARHQSVPAVQEGTVPLAAQFGML
jgi:hypothetical protein